MLYIVYDSEGDPLRRFHSKTEAEWFIKDKPDCKLKKIVQKRIKRISNYDQMILNGALPCLF
jgi:spore germination protein GerM